MSATHNGWRCRLERSHSSFREIEEMPAGERAGQRVGGGERPQLILDPLLLGDVGQRQHHQRFRRRWSQRAGVQQRVERRAAARANLHAGGVDALLALQRLAEAAARLLVGVQRRDRRADHVVDRGLEEVGRPLVAEPHPIVVEADQQHRHRRGREQLPEVLLALLQLAGALQDEPLEPQPILVRAPLVGGDEGPELRDRVVHEEGEDVGGVAAVVAVDLHA